MHPKFRCPAPGNHASQRNGSRVFHTRIWNRLAAQQLLGQVLLAVSILAGWATSTEAQKPLRVAAAADLQPVLPALLIQFEEQTRIHAEVTFQASAALTAQIQAGAPYDVFLSADMGYPQRLIDQHLADGPHVTEYARGTLVLWTRKDSHWPTPTLATLIDPALQRLAIANPERAPYGRAAMAALENLHLTENLRAKLVTAENISQTAQFTETGNADAGLISLTSALTMHMREIGNWFVIPRDLYPVIEQGGVVITASESRAQARRFLEFLLSAPIQKQLAQSGLTPVR